MTECQQCESPRNAIVYVRDEEGREQVTFHHIDCPVAVAADEARSTFLADLNLAIDMLRRQREAVNAGRE